MNLSEIQEVERWCNSYEKLPRLLELRPSVHDPMDWFRVLGDCWSVCDNISTFKDDLGGVLSSAAPEQLAAMMTPEERAALAELPEIVTIYRGCYEWNMDGLSWSILKDVAERFPYLHRYCHIGEEALLVKATALKRNCVLKFDRDESEIICWWRSSAEVTSLGTVTAMGDPKAKR